MKTKAEIELLRDAAQDRRARGLGTLDGARPGATLDELTRRFGAFLAEDGAEIDHFAFSPRGIGIAMHSNTTLRGEVAYLDFGCIRRLVRSDTGLTVAFRTPGRDLRTRFQTLADAVAAGTERLRAGASTSSVWSAMRTAIDGTGVVRRRRAMASVYRRASTPSSDRAAGPEFETIASTCRATSSSRRGW